MPKPIRLHIKRKVTVPTNEGSKYPYRWDWKSLTSIDYSQTIYMFPIYGYGGVLKTEAQFAKWLKDTFGIGEYHIVAWQKGREGFWAFSRINCYETTWKRQEKKITQEQKEMKEGLGELSRKKRQLKEAETPEEKKEIEQELDEIKEEYDLNKEINGLFGAGKKGIAPFLKATLPVYREHDYEDYRNNQGKENIQQSTTGAMF